MQPGKHSAEGEDAGRDAVDVLLVDDSRVVRERLRDLLDGEDGVAVVGEAGSVAEAKAALHEARPDVVVVDLRLPDGTGMDLLRHVRRAPHVPRCIVITAFPSREATAACLALGAVAVLDKATEYGRVVTLVRGDAGAGNTPRDR
jgi:two-component system response regulator DevR